MLLNYDFTEYEQYRKDEFVLEKAQIALLPGGTICNY
jgi:hypothetical protein